jgi:galactose mutarotase-like enzyme
MSDPIFSTSEIRLNGKPIQSVRVPPTGDAAITEFSFAPGLGAATTSLRARVRGEDLDVFPPRDLAALDRTFRTDRNAPFRELNSPLFPNANRLLPRDFDRAKDRLELGADFEATIEGVPVCMPLNHRSGRADAIPHQLHGLLFDRQAQETAFSDPDGAPGASARFHDFLAGKWTGQAEVRVEQRIEKGAFIYEIEAKNVGASPLPVGFGSHPYFKIPSGNPASARVAIPSRRRANVDNFENVLPDGTFAELDAQDPRNFNPEVPGKIDGLYLDSYFVLDPTKERAVELRDREAGVTYRMTALTPNIIGAQIYYPGKGDVVALELVTHHPDPRAELWKTESTGMQLLRPGESARYAYRIEVFARA